MIIRVLYKCSPIQSNDVGTGAARITSVEKYTGEKMETPADKITNGRHHQHAIPDLAAFGARVESF